MCTAVSFKKGGGYFGRTLDNDKSYGEEVVISPRAFPLWRGGGEHYAIIGMATVAGGLPLYYDGMNEKDLCMAGLNFAGNARYNAPKEGVKNIAQWELISYILGTCSSVAEAEKALLSINLTDEPFGEGMPCAPLHWMIADNERDITVECTAAGMKISENHVGVLTNNPPFDMQLFNLNDYMGVSARSPENLFSPSVGLKTYCFGMGGLGLPGDWSSRSRFVRAAFVRNNYALSEGESGAGAVFATLGSVAVPRGCCRSADGWEYTMYSCCMAASEGVYSYIACGSLSPVDVRLAGYEEGDKIIRRPVKIAR